MPVNRWLVSGLVVFSGVTVGWIGLAMQPNLELVMPSPAAPDMGFDQIDDRMLIGLVGLLLASGGTYILHSPSRYAWRTLGRWGFRGLTGIGLWALNAFFISQLLILFLVGTATIPLVYGLIISTLGLQLVLLLGSIGLIRWEHPGRLGRWILGELPALYGVGRGVLEYLRAVPWILGALLVNGMLVQWLGWEDMTPMNVELLFVSEEPWQLFAFVSILVFLAPLGEEFFFRGLLYRNLREWLSSREAGLASALIFGFIHLDPTTVFPLVVVGYLFARSYERTGSLLVVVAMHAVHNGISLLFIFALA